MIGISISEFLRKVYFNVVIVSILSAILPVILVNYLDETFLNFVIISVFSVMSTSCLIYYVGCNRKERNLIKSKIISALKRKFDKR